jgi:DNA-binding NtrC family response regulator
MPSTPMKHGALDFWPSPSIPITCCCWCRARWRSGNLLTDYRLLKERRPPVAADRASSATRRALRQVMTAIDRAAGTDTTVLLEGESGTGKELCARALHNAARAPTGPFVAINCAAIPRNLLEAELFGYERGAFTGATQRKIGKFEMAQRGTIFLDEIGEDGAGAAGEDAARDRDQAHRAARGGNSSISRRRRDRRGRPTDAAAGRCSRAVREDLYFGCRCSR